MKTRPIAALALFACTLLGTGCRGMQIRQLEERLDKLESRTAVLEAKTEMLGKK